MDRAMEKTKVDQDTLKRLSFPDFICSWAIWDKQFDKSTEADGDQHRRHVYEFMLANSDKLKRNPILLGLNRSRERSSLAFSNFHTPGHRGDKKLKEFIQDEGLTNLTGAYMTDVSRKATPRSTGVIPSSKDGPRFIEQLRILGRDSYTAICFGRRVFERFIIKWLCVRKRDVVICGPNLQKAQGYFDGIRIEAWRVWHYSPQAAAKASELKKQLAWLDRNVEF